MGNKPTLKKIRHNEDRLLSAIESMKTRQGRRKRAAQIRAAADVYTYNRADRCIKQWCLSGVRMSEAATKLYDTFNGDIPPEYHRAMAKFYRKDWRE